MSSELLEGNLATVDGNVTVYPGAVVTREMCSRWLATCAIAVVRFARRSGPCAPNPLLSGKRLLP